MTDLTSVGYGLLRFYVTRRDAKKFPSFVEPLQDSCRFVASAERRAGTDR